MSKFKLKRIKFLFFFIICLAFFQTGLAQLIFQKTIGGAGTDYAYDAHRAPTGGYVFGGVSTSFPVAGSVNSYVIKTDDNGDTLWTASYTGIGGSCAQQYVNDLCPLTDGGVVACGGKAVCGDTMVGGNVVRFDANGNVLWSKYVNTYADPYPVIQSNDGNIIVGGYETNGGFAYANTKDALLMKLDLISGDTLWSKRYGAANGDDWFYHILQTPDNGYLSAGFTTSFGQGGRDIYLVKTDANGNLQWSKTYGTAGYECAFGHSIDPTSDGGYILAGQGDVGPQSSKGIFLMKIDGVGNMSWAKYFPGTHGHGVKQTPDHGFIIAGSQTGNNFLIKTDSVGTVLWCKQYAGGDGLILDITNDGGFLAGGAANISVSKDVYMVKTDANGVSGCNESNMAITSTIAPFITVTPATQVIPGGKTVSYTLLLQRGGTVSSLCSTAGIDQSVKSDLLSLFPNPSSGFISIQSQHELGQITIYNAIGENIYSEIAHSTQHQIDLSKYAKGIYFICMVLDGKISTHKISLVAQN